MVPRPVLVALLLAPALAGCVSTSPGVTPGDAPSDAAAPAPRVTAVVADVARGVNPYHEAFRRPWTDHPSAHVPGFPEDAPRLDLTLGDDLEASLKADEAAWATVEPGVVYWVPGTNLLLLTTREADWLPTGRGLEEDFHSTATAHVVARACPECYVLAVQDPASVDGEPVRFIAERLPWVDFVTSTTYPGGDRDYANAYATRSYSSATRALAETGRLFFGPTGNTPVTAVTPVPYPDVDLPPWVVLVGGAHSECRAGEALAGRPAELVGNFSQTLADSASTDRYFETAGTSFATPQVAGFFGRALVDVRRAVGAGREPGALAVGPTASGSPFEDGRLTAEELRETFHATASWFGTTEFAPGCGFPLLGPGSPEVSTAVPVTPAPWLDMGWGYVGEAEAALAARVALGLEPAPEKPAAAAAHMAAVTAARAALYP